MPKSLRTDSSHERRCEKCGYWTPLDDWDEDEIVVRTHGRGEPRIIGDYTLDARAAWQASAHCYSCAAASDTLAPWARFAKCLLEATTSLKR